MGKFDILEHDLVPEFRILNREEYHALRKALGIRKEDLPWIRNSDPVCVRLKEAQKVARCPKCDCKLVETVQEREVKGIMTQKKVIKCENEKCDYYEPVIGPGQILEITRKSLVAGNAVAYRYVVPG